jgi:hypothetical protein
MGGEMHRAGEPPELCEGPGSSEDTDAVEDVGTAWEIRVVCWGSSASTEARAAPDARAKVSLPSVPPVGYFTGVLSFSPPVLCSWYFCFISKMRELRLRGG